jgi:hypothetical protein
MNDDRSLPYRCLIRPEECQAVLKVGGSSVDCQVVDLSREDFHVRIPRAKLKKVQSARKVELRYQGERWIVRPRGNAQPGSDTLYFQRVEELTKTKPPSPWASLISVQLSQQTDPRFVMALMLAFIFACLALPGLGDKVGTAPRLKKGIHSVISSFK